ncbi:MAG: kelch repeat-containing protein [Candidatus Hodarchaeota archaeon]
MIFLIGVSIITNEYYNSGNSEGPVPKNEIIEEDKNEFKLEPPRKAAGATYAWTWMSGNKSAREYGVYGTKGVPDKGNYPGSRQWSVSWTDTNGDFWLFGGSGFAESDIGRMNDLWRINITSMEWAWMSGAKTIDENGVYGTKGVPDVANYPGARIRSVSWTDTEGNLWLFGGLGYPESGAWGRLNDLWRFNITSKEWAWISGNKTVSQNGVYGTKGIPDSVNYPGSRECAISWTDTEGNLWLFGGNGYNATEGPEYLNDLWRFNITSKEWAWMSGNKTLDQNGVYGTKGIPDMANYPGAREYSLSWTDTDENFWLFGGYGYNATEGPGNLNDLWRFNITSKEWTWMSGNKTLNQNGVCGTKEVPDRANYPGGRQRSVSWTDTDGDLWLFGGAGYGESNGGFLNDLWRFNISSKEWAWMSGFKNAGNYLGYYGQKGVPDTRNYPGGRRESVSWTDKDGNLWLFGGYGWSGFSEPFPYWLNDLWRFKDSFAPYITIIEPKYNKLFNATAPSYNLKIIDAHLDDTWYRLWNGTDWSINYTIPGIDSERTGQINQDAWNNCPNGTVIIEFYANDTFGYLGRNSTTIRKDILGPLITINDPAPNELFSFNAPDDSDCDVIFTDVNGIDARWYMLINATDSNHYTKNYTWNGEVNQTAWNQMGNGTVIIRIFANDSFGNIGMAEVTVRKNIVDLLILITKPDLNDIFWKNTMNFTISVSGDNLDTIWYMLINGTDSSDYTNNFTYSKTVTPGLIEDTIQYNLWNQFENGTVIIRFFLNRTNGVMVFDDILVRKDILGPIITINAPVPNELFSSTAPGLADCDVIFSDGSGIADRWYMLINGTDHTDYTNNYTWNGEVDQFVWDYMENGTVIIRIFANDSLGNIGRVKVTVRKDIMGPIITINNPTQNDLFFSTAPGLADCVVIFKDSSGIAARWYMLINGTDNTDYTDNYTWIDEVDQFVWDYMDNGTVIIRIFANDSSGYIGMAEVIVRKEIKLPLNEANYGWIWMSGTKTIYEFGVYGTKGVPDIANYPGARIDSVSWTDTDGNLWLFGGFGFAESNNGWLNDLWRFTITSKEWAWMSGAKTAMEWGVYGTKGVPDVANYPGARSGSVSWTDTDGNLWLFGGSGYAEFLSFGHLNDLWRFNITSNEWTWMSGNKTADENGTYGTKGVPDIANYPGAREIPVSWTDMDGNLWVFGGDGYNESGGFGRLNDLWRFNITSKEWAWISGNKTLDEYGVYGTKGVPDRVNYPGGRYDSISWMDTDGNLWLFGGNGFAESGTGDLNDLWRFNITSKEWAWMSGTKTTGENGVYGTKGISYMANYPGARSGSVSWTDTNGNLWLFGGLGYPESGGSGWLNDLWRFSIISKEWIWISGTKTTDEYGIYSTKGVPDVANNPGARSGSVSWTDTDGNFWLFGGSGWPESGPGGYMNDLWEFWRFEDSIAPNITIIDPMYNNLFNATAPSYNLIFNDVNLYDTWYRLWNGTHWSKNYTIGGSGSQRSGKFNQDAWNNCPNGTVIIEFYANDTFGNLGMNSTTIRKDSLGPIITINNPTPNELFSSTAPSLADCDVIFTDARGIAARWYMLINGTDNTDYTNYYTWNDEVDQFVWDNMDNVNVIIRIFANDSFGNIGMAEVTVRKDILGPIITINDPASNDIFSSTAPGLADCDVIFSDVSGIDARWYMLINGTDNTDYTDNYTWNDEVDQFVWDNMDNGTVIIRIFANDSSGFIGMAEMIIRKDILGPIIIINAPAPNEIFSSTAPGLADCDVIFSDVSGIDARWYMLINGTDNTDYTNNFTWNDEVDQFVWDYMDNGTVIIRIFANDSSGFIGMAEMIIRKDILGPIIIINAPAPNEIFSSTAPGLADCDVIFSDVSGIDARWYMLINGTDNTDYTNNFTWNDEVDQFVWDYMDNGTVIIRIFANDSFGNIGMAEVTVRKDIELPNIIITNPALNEIFGNNTINFTILVSGRNLDTIWYMLINGTNSNDYTNNETYSDSAIAGIYEDSINYNLWNQFENGTLIIRFFLNKTNGVLTFDDVLVRKDTIAPKITIIKPIVNQSVYSWPPEFIIIVADPNRHTMWYRLFNGTYYTENRTFISNTKINEVDWKTMWDSIDYGEIITIIFYCNDTVGNIGFANVTVIKSHFLPIIPTDEDDDDGKKSEEDFGAVLVVLTIIGVSGGLTVAGIIVIKKKIAVKKREKEIRRIHRLRRE